MKIFSYFNKQKYKKITEVFQFELSLMPIK